MILIQNSNNLTFSICLNVKVINFNFNYFSYSYSSFKCEISPTNFSCPNGWTVLGSNGSFNCYLPPSTSLTFSYAYASSYCLSKGARLMVLKIFIIFQFLFFTKQSIEYLKKNRCQAVKMNLRFGKLGF